MSHTYNYGYEIKQLSEKGSSYTVSASDERKVLLTKRLDLGMSLETILQKQEDV